MFLERCKGNISKEEWQDARNNRYLSRGNKTKGGDLNTRLYVVNGQIVLDIATTPIITSNTVRYHRMTVPIYLAKKLSKKTGQINGRNYQQMVMDYLKTGGAYQIEIIRKNNRYYIHVTIEEKTSEPYVPYNGIIGIDTNPEGFQYINNWKQWSALKKAILKSLNKKGVKSLVSWQHHKKQLSA